MPEDTLLGVRPASRGGSAHRREWSQSERGPSPIILPNLTNSGRAVQV